MSALFSLSFVSSCYLCLLLVLSLIHLCLSNQNFDDTLCIESERQALLQFKHGLIDKANRLASWGGERDCCKWAGIGCDNSTGHVHRIRLRALDGQCYDDEYYYDGPYSPDTKKYEEAIKQRLGGSLCSSLLHLKQLRHLDLSCNDFGYIQVPKFIGSLENLEYLNLSYSKFGGIIPPQLGNLSQLHVLSLYDYFSEFRSTNIHWLSSLRMLHHLDMSGVDLSKATNWLQVINTLPSLAQLHMSNCQLLHIHPQVSSLNLTSLSLLDLSDNNFNTSMPPWMFSITSLVSLDLSWCNFHGPIPSSIYSFHNLTSLQFLHVSENDFMNSSLVLKGLSRVGGNLIVLDMRYCGVSSSVLESLHNLTSLHSLDLAENELTETIPKSLGNFCNLRDMDLSDNVLGNVDFTNLLDSFFKCKSPTLESLYLSSLGLSGRLPDELGQLIHLEHLELGDNNIAGTIPDSIGQLSSMKTLDLSHNLISGPTPFSIGRLSLLDNLDLSDNQLNGSIPDSIGRLSSLIELDLSNNQLDRSLPNSLGQLSKLKHLKFFYNLLTGVVTEAHFAKLSSLRSLNDKRFSSEDLKEGNNLTLRLQVANWIPPFQITLLNLEDWCLGPRFPLWLRSQKYLQYLDISNTGISHMPPESIWISLPSLYYLDMSQNHIQGPLLSIPANLSILDLSSNKFRGKLPDLSNTSLPTYELDLSNNSFTGSLHHVLCPYDVQSTSYLNLGYNSLSGVIPECWEKFQNLEFLNLGNNNLSGRIPRSLGSSYTLQSLNLHGNKLSGRLPASLTNLTGLEVLQLGRNELVGSIPAWFGRKLSLLRVLSLRSNQFDGNIPRELCYLKQIHILDLANNNLSGNIPRCFNNFSLLSGEEKTSGLPFKRSVPVVTYDPFVQGTSKPVISSDSLVVKGQIHTYDSILALAMQMDLSNNSFYGNIPVELTTLQKLHELNLSRNQLTGSIPEKIGDMKALESLDVSLNKLSGELPVSLSSLNFLSSLNVSYNNLTGISHVPPESFLPSVLILDMSQNHIQGPLLSIPANLFTLDLSSNKFRGKLPDLSNSSLPTYQLDLSNNSFTGSLHHVLCPYDVQSTVYLNLGYNSLSGVIPECWEKFPDLKFLNLENNNLSGGIPRTLGSSYRLRSLNLHGNKLSGRLPASLMRLTGLEILQLGGNELAGSIPEWFGRKLSVLRLLNLRSNHFDGNIPRELCYLKQIQILDLANNNLSGNIPRCFNNFSILSGEENTSGDPFWETTYVLYVESASLTIVVVISDSLVVKGQIHTYDSILGLVMLMDLSNNSFSGNIPVELTTLQMLQSLNLSRNHLTGSIPEKIGGMKALESFDVSQNKLSGELPMSLSSLNFLSSFNASYNNLTGRIPSSTQLQGFNESSFLGNTLCGDPLAKRCEVEVPATVDQNEDDGSHRADWGLVISIVLGFFAGFWFVVAPLMISISWRIAYYCFLDKLWYMVSDVMLYIQSHF